MCLVLVKDSLDALEILNDALMGRTLGADLDLSGEVLLSKDTILDEKAMEILANLAPPEIILRGNSLTGRTRAVQETIQLGTASDARRREIKEWFVRSYEGKTLAKRELGIEAGTALGREHLEKLLAAETVNTLTIRNNKVRGIEVEAIVDEGVIEPLYDRILGRVLAEDVYSESGELIGSLNETIDADLAERICAVRQKVLIRSVLTCKAASEVFLFVSP